jgi:hypothetical protein
MKFSIMTGQEKRCPFNAGDSLIDVTTKAGLTVVNLSTVIQRLMF